MSDGAPGAWKIHIFTTLFGLIAAPLVGGAAAALAVLFRDAIREGFPGFESLLVFLLAGLHGGAVLGLLPALLLGWPLHVLMMRIQFTGAFVHACFGASLAVAVCRIFLAPALGLDTGYSNDLMELILLAAIAGASGAVTFWLIRRPDLDQA